MTGREPPFFSQERWCWHTGPLQEEQALWPLSAASPVLRNWPEHWTLRWTLAETAPSIEQVSGAILPGSRSLQHWGPKGLMSPLPSFPEKKDPPPPPPQKKKKKKFRTLLDFSKNFPTIPDFSSNFRKKNDFSQNFQEIPDYSPNFCKIPDFRPIFFKSWFIPNFRKNCLILGEIFEKFLGDLSQNFWKKNWFKSIFLNIPAIS